MSNPRSGSTVSRAISISIILAVVFVFQLPAQSPPPAGGEAFPVLAVLPVLPGGSAHPDTALLLGDVLYSAAMEIPNVRVVQTDDTTESFQHDFVLEGTVWEGEGYQLVVTVHDTRRRSVIDSTVISVSDGRITDGIERWRDDMRIVFGALLDDRLPRQTLFLLEEGNTSLAWEYYLTTTSQGQSIPPEVEEAIRRTLAAEIRDTLPSRGGLFGRPALPADAPERLTEVLLLSPRSNEEDLFQRLRQERSLIRRSQLESLDQEVRRELRRGNTAAARELLVAPEVEPLTTTHPREVFDLAEAIRREETEQTLARARAHLRRSETTASRRLLSEAAQPSRATDTLPREVVEAMVVHEQTLLSRDARAIRREATPDPAEPRSLRDRWVWLSIGGAGSADPQERYLDGGVQLGYSGGYTDARSLFGYTRLHRGLSGSFRHAPRDESVLTRVDALALLAPSIATNLLEFSLGITGGASVLWGSRDVQREVLEEHAVLQIGPALGLATELAVMLPGQRLRAALQLTHLQTLWIPDLYPTSATSVGVRIGWVW